MCAAVATVSGMASSRKREKLPDWPKDMGGLDLARKKAKNHGEDEEDELVLTQIPLRQPRRSEDAGYHLLPDAGDEGMLQAKDVAPYYDQKDEEEEAVAAAAPAAKKKKEEPAKKKEEPAKKESSAAAGDSDDTDDEDIYQDFVPRKPPLPDCEGRMKTMPATFFLKNKFKGKTLASVFVTTIADVGIPAGSITFDWEKVVTEFNDKVLFNYKVKTKVNNKNVTRLSCLLTEKKAKAVYDSWAISPVMVGRFADYPTYG